ncbi:NAD(P)-binding protein [Xylaria bambusicola]|uniref:NAD(P)-binding protein n=1 Tax=Xylaria bambusicola TaxID=326684 RepID=UPI002007CFC7|nr:NAD(P)-binding protein [Xylaria bambusicola]KAI0505371.1 NAD(P)-binding protein [Xylaria bambusicola]
MFDEYTTSEEVIETFKSLIKGRTVVLIGAGYPTRASPAHILVASRTTSKVEPVSRTIAGIDDSITTTFVQVDTTDHEAVREAATPTIDVLIHSAGAMATKEYTLDSQGIEFQLSANHIRSFLLTNLLMPALLAADEARFVNFTSAGYRLTPFWFDGWNFSDGKEYAPWLAYGQAKTANILFTYGLGRRLQHRGITALIVHSGYNGDTKLGAHLTWEDYGLIDGVMKQNRGVDWVWEEPRFKTFSQIAATSLIAVLGPDPASKSPAFLQNSQVHEPEEHARGLESVEELWKLSEELVKQRFKSYVMSFGVNTLGAIHNVPAYRVSR